MLPEEMPRFAGVTKLSHGKKDLGDPKKYPIVVSLFFLLLRRALIPSFSLYFFSFLYSAKCRFLSALHFASIPHLAELVTSSSDGYSKNRCVYETWVHTNLKAVNASRMLRYTGPKLL